MAVLYFDRLEEKINLQNHQLRESAKMASVNKTVRKSKSKGVFFEVNNAKSKTNP